jgi:hypothetical protein
MKKSSPRRSSLTNILTVKRLLIFFTFFLIFHIISFSLLLYGLFHLEYPSIEYVVPDPVPTTNIPEPILPPTKPGHAWVNGRQRW